MKIIENRERSIQKKFRVNEKENERIKLMMRKTGITNFSIFARRACCNKEIFSIDFSEYKNIISEISATKSELKRIGNNINQIAKHLNENKNNQTESLIEAYQKNQSPKHKARDDDFEIQSVENSDKCTIKQVGSKIFGL